MVAYRRAFSLASELHSHVARWDSFDKWSAGIQLVRSADSIGANLAESYGRRGHRDRTRFILIARGSALELEHWIDCALARRLPCPDDALDRAQELGRMLNGMARALTEG